MFVRTVLILWLALCSHLPPALSIPVDPIPPRTTLNLGLSTLYREQPDRRREQRYRMDIGVLQGLKTWLRWEHRFSAARDVRPKAEAVQVQNHVYEAYSGLRLIYPYLFRFGLGFGPALLWEETYVHIRADNTSKRQLNTWQLAPVVQLSVDYAINKDWEISASYQWITRAARDKSDRAFGIALGVNSSVLGTRSDVRPSHQGTEFEMEPATPALP